MNVLIADDEKELLEILIKYFEEEGFKVFHCSNGEEAIRILYDHKIDLCILDWMMPKIDGVEVCVEAKKIQQTKTIMLTAKQEIEDELRALENGADDYVRKPFDPRILLLKSKKILNLETQIKYGDLRIDIFGNKIFKNDNDLEVTKTEFELFLCLYRNLGRIVSREVLLTEVWGYLYDGNSRTLDTHMRRLRVKIGQEMITTTRGVGYSLVKYNE